MCNIVAERTFTFAGHTLGYQACDQEVCDKLEHSHSQDVHLKIKSATMECAID